MRRAADRIMVPGQWCRFGKALGLANTRTSPTAPDAHAWCAIGALGVEMGTNLPEVLITQAYPLVGARVYALAFANDKAETPDIPAARLRAMADELEGRDV
jgi:hypothetical protein